ncbi:MAG TPA: TonB-dependent receptor plug domain-containing protein [Opitutaceae bacterium]|nr:TonB-dependent receptor plug domain-containing protein [Opitutaceae bacterium]
MTRLPVPLRRPALSARFLARALSCLLACAGAVALRAAAPEVRTFDVPAGDAITTLPAAARQAEVEIMFPAETVRGVTTHAIQGRYTVRAALDQMLAGTPLTVVEDPRTGALAVNRSGRTARPKIEPARAMPAPATRPGADDTVRLSPFEVRTDQDTSYGALNSNSITRFNTSLNKMPVSADIFTADFMRDTGVTTVEQLLNEFGAGTGEVLATPDSDANNNQPGDRFSVSQIGVRGLSGGNIRRDGFALNGTNTNDTSVFDIERVELIHGPQGLLYGAGGAGGVIVTTSKRAKFNDTSAQVQERIDQYGSKQTIFEANEGGGPLAVVVAGMNSKTQYRRLFIGNHDEGYYGQLAAKLPLHTLIRASAEMNVNDRLVPATHAVTLNSSIKGSPQDPRNNESLQYILATHQEGAVDPVTGLPYPAGAIDNGQLNWENYASFAGWRSEEDIKNRFYIITADTNWTPWLSTNVGFAYNHTYSMRSSNFAGLAAPRAGGNPLDTWAAGSNFEDTINSSYSKSFRASFLATHDFWHGRIRTQTAGGYDLRHSASGATDYGYFLSDANGNIIIDPTLNNLGRVLMPTQWWSVGNGAVRTPFGYQGQATIQGVDATGQVQYFTRMPRNPRSAAWISANNPLGLASAVGNPTVRSGVSGNDKADYTDKSAERGLYLTNYTGWFDDRVETLLGYRRTADWSTTPNTSYSQPYAYYYHSVTNDSWNLGANVKLLPWLRAYYGASATYNFASGANDPYGNPPLPTQGRGQEVGLKFQTPGARLSGSLDYYSTTNHHQNYNLDGSLKNQINPPSLNGDQYQGLAGVNQWIPLDQISRGLELILNAQPTRHWSVHFSATWANGRVLNDKTYGILYNDEFYTDGHGGVTYQDGAPFMVPDPGNTTGLATVNNLSKATNPASIGGKMVQLTTAMIGDPNSPYFYAGAQASPGSPNVSNVPTGAMVGTAKGKGYYVSNAMRYFISPSDGTAITGRVGLPISQIQYNWVDANSTHGTIVAARAGEDTVGYPALRFSTTQRYDFTEGWLRGFSLGGSLSDDFQYRTYYYRSPDGIRRLFSQPELGVQVSPFLVYQHKFGRIAWRTQVNIYNLFNHYIVGLQPNNGYGYTNPQKIGASFYGQPRQYVWTNTISF